MVVHGLKPLNLGQNELIYQTGDVCNEIYFVHTGKVKLFADLNDFILDQNLLKEIQDFEKSLN